MMYRLSLAAGLFGLFLFFGLQLAAADSVSKATTDAINKGATDSSACLPQGNKATFDSFRTCVAKHAKTPSLKGTQADAYRLGLQAQSWLLVNLQSLRAMDTADKASGNDKAAAQKSANVLQEAAHDYFVAMRLVQGKVKVTDPALCTVLGLPYDRLKDYFDFYDHWQ
jgi:hypothetical protein